MVWSSSCSTVAPIAHAVIIARWGVSWWTASPDIFAALWSSSARMRISGRHRQTEVVPLDRLRAGATDSVVRLPEVGGKFRAHRFGDHCHVAVIRVVEAKHDLGIR